jgi:hypothetical protein
MILEQRMSSRKLKAGKVQDHLVDDAIDSASKSTGKNLNKLKGSNLNSPTSKASETVQNSKLKSTRES